MCIADVEDTAAEALQKQADIFRQKPLSAEEQDHVKRIDRIILTSLKKVGPPSASSAPCIQGNTQDKG